MKEYTIEIWSYGYETGIGRISEQQYNYWADREDDLYDALNENIDQDEEGVPQDAQFSGYYNEYSDITDACGPDFENCSIVVKCGGEEVYKCSIDDFHDQFDSSENIEWLDDVWIQDLESGHYVHWLLGGKGLYFEGSFDSEEFKPELLKFGVKVVEGREIISTVEYAGVEVNCDGGEWTGKYSDFTIHEV